MSTILENIRQNYNNYKRLNIDLTNINNQTHVPVFGNVDGINIMTWNIGYLLKTNSEVNLIHSCIKMITEYKCVICLQEVSLPVLRMLSANFKNTFSIFSQNLNLTDQNYLVTMISHNYVYNKGYKFLFDKNKCRMIKINIRDGKKNFDIYNLHIRDNPGYFDFERYILYCINNSSYYKNECVITGDFNVNVIDKMSDIWEKIGNKLQIKSYDGKNFFRTNQNSDNFDAIIYFKYDKTNFQKCNKGFTYFFEDFNINNDILEKYLYQQFVIKPIQQLGGNKYKYKYHKYKTLYLQLKEQIENNGF